MKKAKPADCCPNFRQPTDAEMLLWLGGQVSMSWSACTTYCISRFGHDKYAGEYIFNKSFNYHVGPLPRAITAAMHDEYHKNKFRDAALSQKGGRKK